MTDQTLISAHPTGDLCPGCDCEVVASAQGTTLLLECDCGIVAALAPAGSSILNAA
jgi:hypothetical protein